MLREVLFVVSFLLLPTQAQNIYSCDQSSPPGTNWTLKALDAPNKILLQTLEFTDEPSCYDACCDRRAEGCNLASFYPYGSQFMCLLLTCPEPQGLHWTPLTGAKYKSIRFNSIPQPVQTGIVEQTEEQSAPEPDQVVQTQSNPVPASESEVNGYTEQVIPEPAVPGQIAPEEAIPAQVPSDVGVPSLPGSPVVPGDAREPAPLGPVVQPLQPQQVYPADIPGYEQLPSGVAPNPSAVNPEINPVNGDLNPVVEAIDTDPDRTATANSGEIEVTTTESWGEENSEVENEGEQKGDDGWFNWFNWFNDDEGVTTTEMPDDLYTMDNDTWTEEDEDEWEEEEADWAKEEQEWEKEWEDEWDEWEAEQNDTTPIWTTTESSLDGDGEEEYVELGTQDGYEGDGYIGQSTGEGDGYIGQSTGETHDGYEPQPYLPQEPYQPQEENIPQPAVQQPENVDVWGVPQENESKEDEGDWYNPPEEPNQQSWDDDNFHHKPMTGPDQPEEFWNTPSSYVNAPVIAVGACVAIIVILLLLVFLGRKMITNQERGQYRPLKESFSGSSTYHEDI